MNLPPEVLSTTLLVHARTEDDPEIECPICTNILNDPVQCKNEVGTMSVRDSDGRKHILGNREVGTDWSFFYR